MQPLFPSRSFFSEIIIRFFNLSPNLSIKITFKNFFFNQRITGRLVGDQKVWDITNFLIVKENLNCVLHVCQLCKEVLLSNLYNVLVANHYPILTNITEKLFPNSEMFTQNYQNIKCLIMEFKHSTFQLGLLARNVNKPENNHNNGSNCIVHLKTG